NIVYERLLLPFASDAGVIDGAVSSLKTTMWKDSSAVRVDPSVREAHYSFRAVIGLDRSPS
ncbi:MAG: hypothetical protein JO237_11350, partial [Pseudolabrys sp.]|nr:hypothetical protein [Pseudolabrys sp.]